MADTDVEKTLATQITALTGRIATEAKTLHVKVGDLVGLSTTAKASIVAALNEQVNALETLKTTVTGNTSDITAAQTEIASLKTLIENASNIDDTQTGTDTTYSSSKIESVVAEAKQAVKDDLLGGAGAAYDTLKELADLIATNQDAITALQTIAAGHVRFDEAQTLTDTQKTQARSNIGAASSADVATLQTKVTANETAIEGKASQTDLNAVSAKVTANETAIAAKASQADLEALEEKIGDTGTDFVAVFEAALTDTTDETEGA